MRTQFILPRLERVVSGAGSVSSLAEEAARCGAARALVVTGRTLAAAPALGRVTGALGARCVHVFSGSRQHVPSGTVDELVTLVREYRADGLVSFGGGSPTDTAKGAIHALLRDGANHVPVHIAVPTTLSAGEFTDVAGITDEATRIKHAVFDPRLAPRIVVLDPELTLDTPDWLWAASGIRALDHAVETLYSSRQHAISQPLATRAIAMLCESLGRSDVPNDPIDVRSHCQMAAWLAVFGITNAGFGLSHVLGHQIGPRWNVAHGVTSAIMLPHAMRFMAGAVPERFAAIAAGFGVPFEAHDPARGALACADRATAFIAQFNLPMRLRDVAVPEREIWDVAPHVLDVLAGATIIGRPITRADVIGLLTAAY